MAIEDDPIYAEWNASYEHLLETLRRLKDARLSGDASRFDLAKRDYHKASKAHDAVVEKL